MSAFSNLGDDNRQTAFDAEKARKETQRMVSQAELQRRAQAKVEQILATVGPGRSRQTDQPRQLDAEHCFNMLREMRVGDIMSGRVAVVSPDDTLLTIKGIFDTVNFHHLPVVDQNGDIMGIISDRDFLRVISPFAGTINEQNRDIAILRRLAHMIMTRDVKCATPESLLILAIQAMNEKRISCLPVVQEGTRHLLGVITWKDIVRAIYPDGFSTRPEPAPNEMPPQPSQSSRREQNWAL